MSYCGWDQEELRRKNGEYGTRINMVEADVLVALANELYTFEDIMEATGHTKGQVEQSLGVLREQRLIVVV